MKGINKDLFKIIKEKFPSLKEIAIFDEGNYYINIAEIINNYSHSL